MSTKVLIPDGSSTWALSVINCLSDVPEVSVYVMSSKKRTAVKFSKNIVYFKYYKKSTDKEWISNINSEIVSHSIDVVMPISEETFSFFIKYETAISKQAKIIPLPNKSSFDVAINKKRLSEFCFSNNISHPQSVFVKNYDFYLSGKWSFSFPLLIKPINQKGGDGILRFDDKKTLDQYFHKYFDRKGYFIQQYIEGFDIDCSVLCDKGKILLYTIQKGFLPGHNAFAPSLGVEFLKNDEVLALAADLLKALNWSGVAHIDMRFDEHSQTYKIIEVNARFWGSVEASKFMGINFPLEACHIALNRELISQNFKKLKFMRFKGVLKYVKRHPGFILKSNFIFNNTEVKSVFRDPLPTLYRFFEWFGRRKNSS